MQGLFHHVAVAPSPWEGGRSPALFWGGTRPAPAVYVKPASATAAAIEPLRVGRPVMTCVKAGAPQKKAEAA